jgi:hypothetical protein
VIHYITIYKVSDDRSLERAFITSVRHLASKATLIFMEMDPTPSVSAHHGCECALRHFETAASLVPAKLAIRTALASGICPTQCAIAASRSPAMVFCSVLLLRSGGSSSILTQWLFTRFLHYLKAIERSTLIEVSRVLITVSLNLRHHNVPRH